MKLIFMGTPDFSASILEDIIKSGHEVIAVVTQPDKQKGRGHEVSFTPVKEMALKYDIEVLQPVKIREPEVLAKLKDMAPDVIVVAAFGQILPKELLDIPPLGCINVHFSLLPKYRGAAPIQYAIINGEKETGITIMYMDEGIDTGDIILQRALPIDREETAGSLFDKMAVLGGELIIEALQQLGEGKAVRTPQNHKEATYYKMIHKEMGKLDFSKSAESLERLIRGLSPWPSAYTYLEGKTLKLWKAEVEPDSAAGVSGASEIKPGEIAQIRKDAMVIKTGDGLLVVKELQLEGKKRMAADAFLRGYPVVVGTKLG